MKFDQILADDSFRSTWLRWLCSIYIVSLAFGGILPDWPNKSGVEIESQ